LEKQRVFTRDATGLVRDISSLDSFAAGFTGLAAISLFLFFPIFMLAAPNDNVFYTIALMIIPCFAFAANWALLQIVFPRSGGDYVFNTRLLHPSIGLMTDFLVVTSLPLNFPFYIITILGLFSDLFNINGIVNSDSGATAIGSTLRGTNFQFIIVTIIVVVTMLFMIGRTRYFFRTQFYFFLASVVILVVLFALLATTSNSAYQGLFTNYFKTSYGSVVHSASTAGFAGTAFAGVTLVGMSQLFFWGTGTNWAGHVAGETRRPQTSLLYAIVGSLALYFVLYFILGSLAFNTFGTNFAYALNYLASTGNSPIPMASGAQFLVLAAPIIGNIWIVAIFFVIIAATSFYIGSLAVIAASRKIFAWSFDRVLPSRFSDISDRFRTPIYSAVLIILITEVYVVLSLYGPGLFAIVSGLGVIYTGIFVIVSFLSGVALPRRKEFFNDAPAVVRRKLGPVPVISIIAGIGLVTTFIILGFGQIAPAFQSGLNAGATAWTFGLFFGGLIFYYLVRAYRQRVNGFDVSLVFREIPPE
jgi:APA family basic amino acid/polyamine antiporter